MSSLILAHVISINWDLGKAMKSINRVVSNKLGTELDVVRFTANISTVQEEMDDLNTLVETKALETNVKYNYNGMWMSFSELLKLLGDDIFYNKPGLLEKEVEIQGMSADDYIEMVKHCSSIRKKYVA